jgi:predicted porin
MRQTTIARSVAFAILAAAATSSHAVSYTQNGVTLDINGTINGYYVNRESETTTRATGVTTKSTNSELTNGLLPGWINFIATTQAEGQDIKAHISFAPGINNNSTIIGLPGNANAGAGTINPYSQVDTRNVYFQFGNKDWGSLKFGRDIGLFGQTIILSDMTLIGVGGTTDAGIPFNTTFGMIAHGYMYTGFQPQITYSTPNLSGFSASVGIFQPSKFAGDEAKSPGYQGMAAYDWTGAAPGKVWAGLISQNTSCSTGGVCPKKPFSANGQELGAKIGVGDFEAVGYVFSGDGLGLSTVGAQFNRGSDGNGNRVKSDGQFLQGTYKFGANKLGVNYGQNKDKDGGLAGEITNKAYTVGLYHTLNKYITLVAEYNQEKITDNDVRKDTKNNSISLGGIIFF